MLEFRVFLNKKLIQKAVLSKGKINIGRSVDSDLVLRHEHVSRLHVVIEQEGDVFRLEDKSTNGVLLDGQRITESTHLPPRCRLEIYPFEIECLRLQEDRTAPISKTDIKAPPFEMPLGGTPSLPSALSYHYGILVGESLPMQQVYQLIEDVSNSPVTVLIRGEHGTGKELVARAIHESSPRKDRPFIALNCAAIPLELIESELFGYEKGTFTGAQTLKKGKIEEAHGGTLFLDEVGELSPQAQAKFLRFLQEKAFMRLGSAQEISVDVRILSATNKDLERAIRGETFRADLYYRIKVVQVSLPPLRDRLEDIPLLAAHILERLTRELQLSSIPTVTPQAMNRLQTAQWPGNIRQMENVLYSAVIRSRPPYVIDEQTLLSDSPTWIGRQEAPKETPLDSITRQLLLQTLNQTRWDTAKAADILKVSRATVYYKLKKYGIDPREASKGGSKL